MFVLRKPLLIRDIDLAKLSRMASTVVICGQDGRYRHGSTLS
jgi:hypothetical protein